MKALFWICLQTEKSKHDRFLNVDYSSDEEKDLVTEFYSFLSDEKQKLVENSVMINGGIIK